MKRGFTLIEVLVVLFTLPMILALSIGVLQLMKGIEQETDAQFENFKLQYRYLRQTVVNHQREGDGITYQFNGDTFRIAFDRERLVKTPGYEILLFDVEAVEEHESCLSVRHRMGWFCLES